MGGIAGRAFPDTRELARAKPGGGRSWLAYILSEGDHRLNSVQGWAAGLLMTLSVCLKTVGLRDLDFCEDRLCLVLDRLGRDDAAWESYESKQTATLLRTYDLKALRGVSTAPPQKATSPSPKMACSNSGTARNTVPTCRN